MDNDQERSSVTLKTLDEKVERLLRYFAAASEFGSGSIENLILETEFHISVDAEHLTEETKAREYEHRFLRFTHKWQCDIFNNCSTSYSGSIQMVDTFDGTIPTWNLIETAVRLGTSNDPIPWNYTGEWYKHFPHSARADFGFGTRPHRDRDIWGVARFYLPGGYIGVRWYSHA